MDTGEPSPYVLKSRDSGILRITLNRASRFNPLSLDMIEAIDAVLLEIAGDSTVRVVVLGAEGRGFCAGHDLREIREHIHDPSWLRTLFEACNRMMLRITELPQPVIARVQGIATAAGCQLVSMCDLAFADESATFALPGVNIGVFCSTPAVGVGRNVPRKRAMEMLLTGTPVSAADAASWGLINRAVPGDQLDSVIQSFAERICAHSRGVVALGKKAFYAQLDLGIGPAYGLAADTMTCNLGLGDAAEGVSAFLDKRTPNWQGA